MTGEANLTVGTYAYSVYGNLFFPPSYPYLQLRLGFSISMGSDIQSPIDKLLAPFDAFLWLSLGLCLFVAIALILLSKQLGQIRRHFVIGGRSNRTPIYNMTILLLGGGIGNPRMIANIKYFGTFARTLTMVWFLVTLVLRGSYQGALFGFLQRQVIASPYETITKIFRSDCKLIIMSSAASHWMHTIWTNRVTFYTTIRNRLRFSKCTTTNWMASSIPIICKRAILICSIQTNDEYVQQPTDCI